MKNGFILFFLIFTMLLSAKIVTIEGEYTYAYSDDETLVQAKKKCLDFAKRDALEKFATYISSESVYKDYMTEKDEVVARSLGVLKNLVINEENIDKANSTIFYKVTAEIDEDEVLKKLEKKQETNTMNVKIKDFVKSGMNAESQLRIGDALKYYYWALLLVKSEPKSASLKCEELDDRLLTISLPEKINSILTSLEFTFKDVSESKKYKYLGFEIKYKGAKVNNLQLTYFNGDVWSNPVKVRDGEGSIELFGDAAESITKLSLQTDYMYEEQCNYDHNVKQALKKVSHIPFSSAKFKVKIPKAKKDVVQEPVIQKPIPVVEETVEKPVENKVEKPVVIEHITPVKKDNSMLAQHYNNNENDQIVKKSFFGFKGGLNTAIFSGDDVMDGLESQEFFNIGMFSVTNINKNIAFQIELNYSQKGAYAEDWDYYTGLWTENNWLYDYMELPMILKISMPINNSSPNFYLGFSYGVLISATYDWTDEWGDSGEIDMSDVVNSSEASFIIGGGLDYVLNQKTLLLIDLRYTVGITPIYNEDEVGELDMQNSVFSVNFGIGF
ncbi:MAG: PorT family protein [Candidatus Delongbacteria bacterium]|nr:PorT family protein [Candidatus Delongbacteria bacterium]